MGTEIAIVVDPPTPTSRTCPTCGYDPITHGRGSTPTRRPRGDLAPSDPDHRGTVIGRHHCRHCEPGQPAFDIACSVCGGGPILAGRLAELAEKGDLTKPARMAHLGRMGRHASSSMSGPGMRREGNRCGGGWNTAPFEYRTPTSLPGRQPARPVEARHRARPPVCLSARVRRRPAAGVIRRRRRDAVPSVRLRRLRQPPPPAAAHQRRQPHRIPPAPPQPREPPSRTSAARPGAPMPSPPRSGQASPAARIRVASKMRIGGAEAAGLPHPAVAGHMTSVNLGYRRKTR